MTFLVTVDECCGGPKLTAGSSSGTGARAADRPHGGLPDCVGGRSRELKVIQSGYAKDDGIREILDVPQVLQARLVGPMAEVAEFHPHGRGLRCLEKM